MDELNTLYEKLEIILDYQAIARMAGGEIQSYDRFITENELKDAEEEIKFEITAIISLKKY